MEDRVPLSSFLVRKTIFTLRQERISFEKGGLQPHR
jgi:hypothetical protein